MTLGDTHLYKEHVEKVIRQINRVPLVKPTLTINKEFDAKNSTIDDKVKFIEKLSSNDFILNNYSYWPGIKLGMIA